MASHTYSICEAFAQSDVIQCDCQIKQQTKRNKNFVWPLSGATSVREDENNRGERVIVQLLCYIREVTGSSAIVML